MYEFLLNACEERSWVIRDRNTSHSSLASLAFAAIYRWKERSAVQSFLLLLPPKP
jgi:hypothetical protein